jgi:hypothetical protein
LRRRLDRIGDNRLHLVGQRIVLRLVERDFELLGILVIALQHAHLGHVGETEDTVGSRVIELRRIEQPAVHRRYDFAARQRIHRRAHRREQINRDADGAVFNALEIIRARDRLLEPAERLGIERRIRK